MWFYARRFAARVLSLVAVLSLTPYSATAITLDTFEDGQSIEAFVGIPDSGSVSSQNAIGGFRSVNGEVTDGTGVLRVDIGNLPTIGDILDHSQTLNAEAISVTHWDGDSNENAINPTGLGGIDLAEDGGTAFVFDNILYDQTAAGSEITVRAYDASDASGNTYSDFSLILPSGGSGNSYSLPFNAPSATGSGGAADIGNIGALSLTIDGSIPGADLGIQFFRTNGPCELIPPVGGRVLDDCGECIPPTDPNYNQSCTDCLGVPNGNTLPGDSCETGELGPCAEGMYNNDCECERIVDPVVEICDGADNNCNGEIDEVFPQLGAQCGVSKEECEVTGVFICDETGGVQCDIDFTNSNLADCGIDVGCDGVPGSGAIPDECGVCGGDGSTCEGLECDSVNISELLFAMDGGAKFQEGLIRSATKVLSRNSRNRETRQYVKETRAEANALQIANWILSWTLPIISVQCDSVLAAEVCVQTDNSDIINTYIERSKELRTLGIQVAKQLRRATGNKRLAKRWRKRMKKRHRANIRITDQVPRLQSVCTGALE